VLRIAQQAGLVREARCHSATRTSFKALDLHSSRDLILLRVASTPDEFAEFTELGKSSLRSRTLHPDVSIVRTVSSGFNTEIKRPGGMIVQFSKAVGQTQICENSASEQAVECAALGIF